MKKTHKVFIGFAVLMIAAMFTLAGCDNGTNSDPGGGPLEGTWVDSSDSDFYRYVFTGNDWIFQMQAGGTGSWVSSQKGTYTGAALAFTLTLTHDTADGTTWTLITATYSATLAGNSLTVTDGITPYSYTKE
jgi:hypothetical protein